MSASLNNNNSVEDGTGKGSDCQARREDGVKAPDRSKEIGAI